MMPTHDAFTFDVYDDTYDALPILRDELCQSKTTTSNEQRSAEGGTDGCNLHVVVPVNVRQTVGTADSIQSLT